MAQLISACQLGCELHRFPDRTRAGRAASFGDFLESRYIFPCLIKSRISANPLWLDFSRFLLISLHLGRSSAYPNHVRHCYHVPREIFNC